MKGAVMLLLLTFVCTNIFGQRSRKDKFGNNEVIGKNGEILEYHFLDLNGNLRQGERIAKKIFTYDSSGFLASETFLKANGRPYQYADGMAIIRYHWNGQRDRLVVENLDSTGRRAHDRRIGASLVAYTYDSSRKIKEVSYFDTDSIRVDNTESYSRVEYINLPISLERYYDKNDTLIRELDDATKYLRGLQLQGSSIPKWLREAKQRNLVDGIVNKSLAYSLTLHGQNFEGEVQLGASITGGDLSDVHLERQYNVSEKLVKKIINSFQQAHFISLTNSNPGPIKGTIFIHFEKKH